MFEVFLELMAFVADFAGIPTSREMDRAIDGVDETGKRIGPIRRTGSIVLVVSGILGVIAFVILLVVVLFSLLAP